MKRNFNGLQINQSATIVGKAGVAIEDVRNRILAYDNNGDVILAADGTVVPAGIAIIEAGLNDISGTDSGKVAAGDDIDIQIKDIGYVIAGADITKGAEIMASKGLAIPATAGNYVAGIALSGAVKDEYIMVQIARYQKSAAAASN